MKNRRRVLIMGAAGRDFHNFNAFFRDNENYEVLAFTATQIPNIEGRIYPPLLAGSLYPRGILIYPESDLPKLVKELSIDEVVFAYSDVSHSEVMHKASTAMAAGADFRLMGPQSTMLKSSVPVVSVCAVRTGAGKSQTTRKVCDILKSKGLKVVAVRHPMPYGDLTKQVCQRYEKVEDLAKHNCTIEEREEYNPHIESGIVVFAGVDYEKILKEAEKEAQVIVWDGGNNDFSFYYPDLQIVVVDPHRPGHEIGYFPGELNLKMADIVIINKVDTAQPANIEIVRKNIIENNPSAKIIEASSPIYVEGEKIKGKRVLAIEDGPTLTHGDMGYGAAVIASKHWGAAEIVDPRPYAVGTIKGVYEKFKHLNNVLPAMGYSPQQMEELKATIEATPCDIVVIGTPVDLSRFLKLSKPSVRIRYELEEKVGSLTELLEPVVKKGIEIRLKPALA